MSSKKYIFAFLITALIFGTAIYTSNFLNQKKLEDIRSVENRMSLNILSGETQTALLQETSCKDVTSSFLSHELSDLGDKLSYAASQNNPDSAEIQSLKQYYSLLEIKDYLLMKHISAKCGIYPAFILYFYSDKDRCPDCEKTGYVLDALHDKYPNLRIYSFDYYSTEPAVKTLISIYHVENNLPALIINTDPYYGFRSLDTLETTVPAIKRLKAEYTRNLETKKQNTSSTSSEI